MRARRWIRTTLAVGSRHPRGDRSGWLRRWHPAWCRCLRRPRGREDCSHGTGRRAARWLRLGDRGGQYGSNRDRPWRCPGCFRRGSRSARRTHFSDPRRPNQPPRLRRCVRHHATPTPRRNRPPRPPGPRQTRRSGNPNRAVAACRCCVAPELRTPGIDATLCRCRC